MPRLTRDEHLFGLGPKRILAIDGGGIRSLFSIKNLYKIESIVRQRTRDESAVLSDYFDLIGGTSTGSILASGLALGWPVTRLEQFYRTLSRSMFQRSMLRHGVVRPKYSSKPLRALLKKQFGEMTLGDSAIRTGLAIITKRLDTGSIWVLLNNPKAPFFSHSADGITPHKNYLLRDIIRASSASPYFFEPERIMMSDVAAGAFVGGDMSPHNNPALQLLLLVTLDSYNLCWPLGEDNLLVVSVGSGHSIVNTTVDEVMKMKSAELALQSLQSLMSDTSNLNELLLQMVSHSPTARRIDREIGVANVSHMVPWLSYLRYDAALESRWLQEKLGLSVEKNQVEAMLAWDDPSQIELYERVGQLTAEKLIDDSHFPSCFDVELSL